MAVHTLAWCGATVNQIKIILINHGKNSFEVTDGMRIAQLVIAPVIHANFILVKELEETKRGSGGFGHTG